MTQKPCLTVLFCHTTSYLQCERFGYSFFSTRTAACRNKTIFAEFRKSKGDERMITIKHLNELFQIINGEHADPHAVLGMHEVEENGTKCVVARAFIPGAQTVTVVDAASRRFKYPMERIHEDGFFEVIIPDRTEWFRYRLECTDYQGNSWHTYDPYAFQPTISEYDRYLFGAGNHYDI